MKLLRPVFLWLLVLSALTGGCELRSLQTIKIGVIAYLRGDGDTISASGTQTRNAASLFVQEVNKSGGVQVGSQFYQLELVVEPIANDPTQALEAVRSLIEKGVVAIVGPQYSGDAIAVGNVVEEAKIPLISGTATNPQVTEGRSFVFRIGFSDDVQAAALAAFAARDLQVRRVAIFYDETDTYSNGVAQRFTSEFQNGGGKVVAAVSSPAGNKDIVAQLSAVLDSNPEVVFIPSNYPEDVIFQVGELRRGGYAGIFLGSDGWDSTTLVKLPAFDGSYSSTTYSSIVTMPRNRTFVDMFQKTYDSLPNDGAGTTYDAFGLIVAAIRHKQSFEPQDIRDGLMELSKYEGISGSIDYVDSGNPVKPTVILYFNEGSLEFYKAFQQ